MNQFKAFMAEKIIQTDRKETMNCNHLYDCYFNWYIVDNEIVKGYFENGHYNDKYIKPILRYDKKIGRLEFYELLKEIYGQPPLINKKTKQYSYYLNKI